MIENVTKAMSSFLVFKGKLSHMIMQEISNKL